MNDRMAERHTVQYPCRTISRWCILLLVAVSTAIPSSLAFLPPLSHHRYCWPLRAQASRKNEAALEAQRLLEKSQILRKEIAQQESQRNCTSSVTSEISGSSKMQDVATTKSSMATPISKWSVPSLPEQVQEQIPFAEYRLYVDIGREEGTWMEPRWGASGRRIEFTLDVRFLPGQLASADLAKQMVQDNQGGRRSSIYHLQVAPYARLRNGFDEMDMTTSEAEKEGRGAYRIDRSTKTGQSDTLRFFVTTQGSSSANSYGDINVPAGNLYFSIPCFGGSVSQLSTKGEMPVTVRQMGWHTGWRRAESRIAGTFRAVPIAGARRKDGR